MYVTSTDADIGDANDYIVGIFNCWSGIVFEAGVTGAIE